MNMTPNRFVAGLMAGVASALLVAAAPASASAADNAPPTTTEGTAAQAPAPTAKIGSPKKYCVKDQLTGSRMYTTVCKTKAEWAAQGVDITAG